MKRGDLVQFLFDTGAMGASVLYGKVIAAGPKAYRVMWESGLSNRCLQGNRSVKLAADQVAAAAAVKRRSEVLEAA